MEKLILPDFWERHSILKPEASGEKFSNNDENIKMEAEFVKRERKRLGLEGIVGGLSAVIINTEQNNQISAVDEFLRYTGFELKEAFEREEGITYVLKLQGSADVLIRSRKGENPFLQYNENPKSKSLPNTRLETFVFNTCNIRDYVSIQRKRGVRFMTDDVIDYGNYLFIQTMPSSFTGNSIGLIEWKKDIGSYSGDKGRAIDCNIQKPDKKYLKNIKEIDHAATRVNAKYRDAAIIEFMELTNYNFDFAIYVESLNSITNVARLGGEKFALVFTSGISPYSDEETAGPTEKYIHNYGTRVHHIAYRTENIEETFENLKRDGMEFLIDLVGSEEEGLKQTFTRGSKNTFIVNEYILRYGDFDGFFTKSNVTKLTKATEAQ